MATIDFPLSISEMTKMHEDGDAISLFFSYGCIVCFVLIFVLGPIYYLSEWAIFKLLAGISLSLSAICLLMVYIYRPIFLSDDSRKQKASDRKKFKALDKLVGKEAEEAMEKLTAGELDRYLSFETHKVALKCIRRIWKRIS